MYFIHGFINSAAFILVVFLAGCGGGGGSSTPAASTPAAINRAPILTDPGALSVVEGSTSIVTISASDPDSNALTFTISSGDDQALFSIASSGALSFSAAPDFESPGDTGSDNVYDLTVQVSDGTLTDTQLINVTVTDAFQGRVVDAPISGASVFVDLNGNNEQDEGEPAGTTDANGFFSVDTFTPPEGGGAKVVSKGGTDTKTGKALPDLVLISDLPTDITKPANVTPLTTVVASVDTPEAKAAVLTAMGITSSPEALLTNDGWAAAEAGDEEAKSNQRINQQVGLLLQTASTIIDDGDDTTDTSIQLAQAVAIRVSTAAVSDDGIDLASSGALQAVLIGVVADVVPDAGIATDAITAIATSVAEVNALVGAVTLEPTSTQAAAIVLTAQNSLQLSVASVVDGTSEVDDFEKNNTTSELFSGNEALASQPDFDGDNLADAADLDDDNDGISDENDAFPRDKSETLDSDLDGVGDNLDRFPSDPKESLDSDHDGVGDSVDTDRDGDGVLDSYEETNEYLTVEYKNYDLSSFFDNTCLLSDGVITCFGDEQEGELTVPTLTDPIKSINVGGYNSCAIVGSDSEVACWGEIAPDTLNGKGYSEISVGGYHVCGINEEGVSCAGVNDYSQTVVPVDLTKPKMIAAGQHHTCALDAKGVQCWGRNDYGQSTVPELTNPRYIAAGVYTSCAIDDSGIICWGENDKGQANPPSLNSIQQISVGYKAACALSDQSVKCWGNDGWSLVTGIPALSSPSIVSVGSGFACALHEKGVACWGETKSSTARALGNRGVPPAELSIDPDRDGVTNQGGADSFPFDASKSALAPSEDADGDGILNGSDAFPTDKSETIDTDSDGVGNNADDDDDGDGVIDTSDAFPLDKNETIDTDSDGIGNTTDTDDDGDGISDSQDGYPLDSTKTFSPSQISKLSSESSVIINNVVFQNSTATLTLQNTSGKKVQLLEFDGYTPGPTLATSTDDTSLLSEGYLDPEEEVSLTFTVGVFNLTPPLTLRYKFVNPDTLANDFICSTFFSASITGDYANVIDSDCDSFLDTNDTFKNDVTEWIDTDSDGVGNNTDTDDDGDGVLDSTDTYPLDSTKSTEAVSRTGKYLKGYNDATAQYDIYLGCLDCNAFSTDSVQNAFGTFGDYASLTTRSQFSKFGNTFGSFSACNTAASYPPLITDDSSGQYGYFSKNTAVATSNSTYLNILAKVCE